LKYNIEKLNEEINTIINEEKDLKSEFKEIKDELFNEEIELDNDTALLNKIQNDIKCDTSKVKSFSDEIEQIKLEISELMSKKHSKESEISKCHSIFSNVPIIGSFIKSYNENKRIVLESDVK